MLVDAHGQAIEAGVGFVPAPLSLTGYACARCRTIYQLDEVASCSCGAILETRRVRPGAEHGAVPDPSWQETLNRYFGFNRWGQPRFRIAWNPERYPQAGERWVIEMWHPPERYGSPEVWYATEPVLGDYPFHGDYEWVYTFEYPKTGEFATPSRQRVEYWCRITEETLSRTYRERLAESRNRHERNEQAKDAIDSDRYDDTVKQPFYGAPMVSLAGPKSKGRRVTH